MEIRENLQFKYYIDWKPKNSTHNKSNVDITNDLLIKMYNEYIIKLNEFIAELNNIGKNITKNDFKPNYRQIGGYERCVTNYPDTGWKEKYQQFIQAYKELMVDFLNYPDLEYDELSIKEIKMLKEMAIFLINKALSYIGELI